MQKLYIMMGIQGAGKTEYAKSLVDDNTVHISRNEIRFNLIKPNEEYFSKEAQVFKTYIDEINDNLSKGKNVIADDTHLTKKSRNKLFHYLKYEKDKVEPVVIFVDTPLDVCLERNETRKGSKSYVPKDVIKKAYTSLNTPSIEEQKAFGLKSMITIWNY